MRRAGSRATGAPGGYCSEVFYRATTHNGTEEGFSLGLSIVMRLCDTAKHRVRMDLRPGRDMVFKINLEPHEGWSGSISERQDSFPAP